MSTNEQPSLSVNAIMGTGDLLAEGQRRFDLASRNITRRKLGSPEKEYNNLLLRKNTSVESLIRRRKNGVSVFRFSNEQQSTSLVRGDSQSATQSS